MVAAHIRGIMYEHKAPLASWTKMLVMIMIMEIGDMSSDKSSTTNRARERCSLLDLMRVLMGRHVHGTWKRIILTVLSMI